MIRPKLGAVNMDVIDAVNARLAAVNANSSSNNDLFRAMRVETSVENNDVKKFGSAGDVEVC